jgi:predicted alpha/beta superfamily hydrolase
MIKDWNQELTPWVAPPIFGKTPFGDGAEKTLEFITSQLLPEVQENITHLILGGYSLAGLFALWAGYQTDRFEGIAAASPSVWYPQWIDYASENKPFAKSVYLSLGDKEEKAKNRWNSESHQARLNGRVVTEVGKANPVMAQVGNAIRKQHELLTEQEINTILEWNAGNHFVDSDKRMAKGFAWAINNL